MPPRSAKNLKYTVRRETTKRVVKKITHRSGVVFVIFPIDDFFFSFFLSIGIYFILSRWKTVWNTVNGVLSKHEGIGSATVVVARKFITNRYFAATDRLLCSRRTTPAIITIIFVPGQQAWKNERKKKIKKKEKEEEEKKKKTTISYGNTYPGNRSSDRGDDDSARMNRRLIATRESCKIP